MKLYQQLNEYKNWQNLNDVYEFIVIDNNSLTNQQKSQLIEDFKWLKLIILKSNGGPSVARNVGIRNAKAKFIQFIDDDDLVTFGKVKAQHKFLIENPEIDVVIGGTQKETWNENTLPKEKTSDIMFPDFIQVISCSNLIKTNGFFQIGAALFKKEVLIKIGGFDERRWFIEDVDLYLRLLKTKATIKVEKNLTFGFFWRVDNVSLSKSNHRLFLDGCLLNYIFCIENRMMVTIEDHIVVYSGIYNILKQGINLPEETKYRGLKVLERLSYKEKLEYLPTEVILGLFLGFPNLFRLGYVYRQIKKRIK